MPIIYYVILFMLDFVSQAFFRGFVFFTFLSIFLGKALSNSNSRETWDKRLKKSALQRIPTQLPIFPHLKKINPTTRKYAHVYRFRWRWKDVGKNKEKDMVSTINVQQKKESIKVVNVI
jgi:hypothetical protein